MAEINTGLGWAANSDWLVRSAGTTIVNLLSVSGATRIPNTAGSAADIISNGVYIGCHYDRNWNRYIDRYVGCADGVEAVVFWTSPTSGSLMISVGALSPNVSIYVAGVERGSGSIWGPTELLTPASPDQGAYYATQLPVPGVLDSYPAGISVYPDQATGWASVSTTAAPFTKTNEGYAVAALAKWKTGSAVITTPVLISSVSEYTDMEAPASTSYNLAKLNVLHSGMRFYMSFWDIADNPGITTQVPVFDYSDPTRPALTLENVFKFIASVDYAAISVSNAPDPYQTEGGGSEEEGGEGEDTGDDDAGIEVGSDFPSAINTGFCRIFSPSESDLRDLSNYLWSSSYDLEQVKKLFSNPMDSILGLSAVPIRLLGSSVSFSLGGVPITGMTLPLVTQQRYTYHMGSVTIKERWGSYLDYDPYTKFSIFLPFIGMRELAADDIMGKTVSLVYDIDILTGMCVARLQAGTNCLYEWGGNCAIQLPVNSRNWDSVFSTAVSAVGGIVSAVTGGSAPLVAGSVASAALQSVSMKPRIDKSSTIGGAAGWLGQMTPYIIRTTPEAFIPTDQNKFIGYPAYINVGLDAISGYNEVESIHLENVTATGAELEEIESILKGGVIF